MNIECPHCQFSKEIADDKLPPLPAKVTCPQCSEQFTLEAPNVVIEEEPLLTEDATMPTTAPVPPTPPVAQPATATAMEDVPAGFWVRVLASIIDSVLLQVIGFGMGFGMQMVLGGTMDPEADPTVALLMLAMGMVLSIAYYVFFTGYNGQTPGKMALRIKVIHNDGGGVGYGQAFVREVIGKFFSGVLLCIGYLMVAFRADKRGLHDLMARTRVIKV